MSEVDLVLRLRDHNRSFNCVSEEGGLCFQCLAAAEIERLRKKNEDLAHIAGDHLATAERFMDALEIIASNEDQSYRGRYLYHKGRADGLRCAGAVARAALHTDTEEVRGG